MYYDVTITWPDTDSAGLVFYGTLAKKVRFYSHVEAMSWVYNQVNDSAVEPDSIVVESSDLTSNQE